MGPGEATEPAPLRRKLGFWMCLALVMGSMIGSGVFLLPTALAPLGWNAVPAWLLTIGGALCIASVLGRLTRALPAADGPHGFTRAAFGEMPAFLVAWSYWISIWVGNAAIALAATSYLSVFAPVLGRVPGLPAVITIGFVWIIAGINMRGARAAGAVSIITMVIKLLPIMAVMGIVLVVAGRSAGAELAPLPASGFSLSAITSAAALTLWAALGFEAASASSDRVDNPGRTLPRALMWGVGLAGFVYVVACSGIALLLPPEVAMASDAPFADFVERYWGRGPALLIALFAAVSALGALNGLTLTVGAIPLTLARAGSFPKWFAVTSANGTPVRAIAVGSAMTTILLVLNSSSAMATMFTFMALLSTSSTLFLYLMVSLSAAKLRVGGAVAIVGVSFSLWTLWGAGFEATGWSAVLLLAGAPVYLLMRRPVLRAS